MGPSELSSLLVQMFKKPEKQEIMKVLWDYSRPCGRPAPRAFLFTINGLTYPIHKEYCFAGVPFPSEVSGNKFNIQRSRRTYSMLANLLSVRRGDLLFFFQADPQHPQDIDNRRGFRGVWQISSEPFLDTSALGIKGGYEILGSCPYCGEPFDFGGGEAYTQGGERKCLWCGKPFGFVRINKQRFSKVIISLRVCIEPIVVFRRTTGDNRVYTDMGTPPLIWVSRADNAMGPGKGSSIRVLLPEEMAKIVYMLMTEDDQSIIQCEPNKYPGVKNHIVDYNGQPIEYLRSSDGRTVQHELMLNLYFAMNIDKQGHSLIKLLGLRLDEIEYWTSEFPWGYTGDTADFVLTMWKEDMGRHAIYLFEFKKDRVDVEAIAEILLYIPWVSQVLTQFRGETKEITVYPVLVGNSFGLRYVPDEYSISIETITGVKKLKVQSPILLRYSLSNMYQIRDRLTKKDIFYARDLLFHREELPAKSIKPPPPTYTTTTVEKHYVARKYLNHLAK